jgi:hypothetical protein
MAGDGAPHLWLPVVLLLAGCAGSSAIAPPPPDLSTPRGRAVAEMRAQAEAGEAMPYPDPYQGAQIRRLAARPEPLTTEEVAAAEAELALIAQRRAGTTNPREIAALEKRAAELRRLASSAPAALR